MAVVLSMIAKGLYIIGGVTVFFAILCLSTLNAKPNAKNQALLAQLSPEQIAQGKKNARNAIIYIFSCFRHWDTKKQVLQILSNSCCFSSMPNSTF